MADELGALARRLKELSRSAEKLAGDSGTDAARELAASVRSAPGHPSYRRVYRRLASGVDVRPDRDGPLIVVAGGRSFTGGASISDLAGAYEYGRPRGDARTGRRKGAKRGSQFPPPNPDGWWLGATADRKGPAVQTEWADDMADAIGKAWGGR
jgi:hypothetical protein